MSKVRFAIAILIALVAGFACAAPASAATSNRTLDCDDNDQGNYTYYVAPGDSIDFSVTGCNRVKTYDTDSNLLSTASLSVGGSHKIIAAAPGLTAGYYEFYHTTNGTLITVAVVEYDPAYAITGSLLATHSATIGANPQTFTVADNTGNNDHDLAGNTACNLQATPSKGMHVYGTIDIHISTAGLYTFRSIGSTPPGSYVDPENPFHPLGDSMLAVYSTFDPARPDQGVVGCNDDSLDQGTHSFATMTSSGILIEGSQPWFQATMQPGNYTLVVTTWEELTAAQWQSGATNFGETFTPGSASNNFELWGPAGGLTIGHVATTPGLANTGQNLGLGFGVAGAVLIAGLTVLVIRRRFARK